MSDQYESFLMEYSFFLTSFLLGIVSASPQGPLSILIFNRAAMRGFRAGFATGLGSALADSMLISFGLTGFLQTFFSGMFRYVAIKGGGALLLLVGCVLFLQRKHVADQKKDNVTQYKKMVIQGFMLTVFNPMTLLFFMGAGTQLLNLLTTSATVYLVVTATFFVLLGAAIMLAVLSASGHMVGKHLNKKHIVMLQTIVACLLCLAGLGMVTGIIFYIPIVLSQFLQYFS